MGDVNVGPAGISALFGSSVLTQTNTGTAGGTMYYINMGGIKLLWGVSAANSLANSTTATYTWTLPTSFFTTLQLVAPIQDIGGAANGAVWTGLSAKTTTTITTALNNQQGSTQNISHSIFVIGT